MNSHTAENTIAGEALPVQKNEKLQYLFMQAPAAIALLEGPNHTYTLANPLYQRLFGRTEKDLLGRKLKDVFPEVEGQGIYELFGQVYATGEAFTAAEFPATFQDAGGTKNGYYNFVIQPIRTEAGAVTDLLVQAYDVTNQVAARKKVEQSELKYRSLFQTMDQGFCIIEMLFDEKGQPVDYLFLEVNPVFENQTGLKNAAGKTAKTLVPDLEERWFRTYGAVALTGQATRFIEGSEAMGRWFEVYAFRMGEFESRQVAILFTDITERKTAELALQKTEARFRSLIEEAPVATCLFAGRELRIEIANEKMIAYMGKGNEIIGKPLAEALPELQGQPFLQVLDDAFITGKTVEARAVPADVVVNGEKLTSYFDYTFKPLRNAAGEVYGIIDISVDVTEQVMSRKKLEESESRFRMLADQSPMFVFIIEPDAVATVSYWNKTWLSYTGQTAQEAMGRAWDGIIHSDDVAIVLSFYASAFQQQQPYFIPAVRTKRHDGEYRWHAYKGNPRYTPDGRFNGYIGVGFDVQEQKITEESLEHQVAQRTAQLIEVNETLHQRNSDLLNAQNFLETVLDVSVELVTFCDKNLVYKFVNQNALDFTGKKREEILNKRMTEVYPGIEKAEVFELIQKALAGERVHVQSRRAFSRKDAVVETYFIPLITGGEIEGVVTMSRDITALVKLTEDLQRSNEDLQQFAHVVSHDLKEPVRKIRTFNSRLAAEFDAVLPAAARTYMAKMESAASRIYNMIDGVLLYSSLNALEGKTVAVDLNKTIEEIKTDLELAIQQNAAVIQYNNLPVVSGIPVLLYQLFYNLLNNAIKFSLPGTTPLIKITSAIMQAADGGKTFVRIVVNDNGIGFSQQHAEEIFKTFTRLHAKDKFEGTGLGLALCKKIAERHGGSISAQSEEGKGASFTVTLPTVET